MNHQIRKKLKIIHFLKLGKAKLFEILASFLTRLKGGNSRFICQLLLLEKSKGYYWCKRIK